jgi:general secretion pathway protein A
VYKYSGGLPRLINIACDRALLTAFGYNQLKITGAIARGAVRELQGKGNEWYNRLGDRWKWILPLSVILVFILLVILFRSGTIDRLPGQWAGHTDAPTRQPVSDAPQIPSIETTPEQSQAIDKIDPDTGASPAEEENVSQVAEVVAAVLPQSHEAVVNLPNNLKELLQDIESAPSRIAAAKAALALWGVEEDIEKFQDVPDEQTFFQLVCKQNDLLVRRFEGNLGLLENIDLPAVLRLELSEGLEPKYLTLCKIRGGMVTLCGVGENFGLQVEAVDLLKFWPGVAFVPWKNFMNISGIIPEDTDDDSILALKAFLREIGFAGIDDTPFYDERTRQAIISIQEKYRIHVDGVVGPSTKVVLYNEKKSLPIPRILEND